MGILGYNTRIMELRQTKTTALPQAEIGTVQGWQRLQNFDLVIMSGRAKRERLADYLQKEGSQAAFTITDRAGWHGNAYILPSGETITATDKDPAIIYNGDTSQAKAYQPNGELTDWQQNIARFAAGNSRLCLALGASFAAPLLSLLNEESGGFHLTEYWLIPVVFEEEICQNFDKLKVCEVLHTEQWLKKPNNGRWQHQRKYNGASARFYVLMGEAPPDIDE